MAGSGTALHGSNQMNSDFLTKSLQQYTPASPGVAAGNLQATPGPQQGQLSPGMQMLGGVGSQLGQSMMQAGQRPNLPPAPMQRPMPPGAQNFAQMPAPWMQGHGMNQQAMTPATMGALLAKQNGLMGYGRQF